MDLSKLSSNDRMAAYAAVVLVIGGIISNWGGLMWLSVLAGILVLVVIFLPQLSPQTSLPGSKGSLLVVLGAVAAAGAVIEILRFLNYFFRTLDDWQTWAFAIALLAALYLAWSAWKEFQSEGGQLKLGTSSAGPSSGSPPAGAPPPASPPQAGAPPATPPPAAAAPPPVQPAPPTASADDSPPEEQA